MSFQFKCRNNVLPQKIIDVKVSYDQDLTLVSEKEEAYVNLNSGFLF
jgi:hypothetical protein